MYMHDRLLKQSGRVQSRQDCAASRRHHVVGWLDSNNLHLVNPDLSHACAASHSEPDGAPHICYVADLSCDCDQHAWGTSAHVEATSRRAPLTHAVRSAAARIIDNRQWVEPVGDQARHVQVLQLGSHSEPCPGKRSGGGVLLP